MAIISSCEARRCISLQIKGSASIVLVIHVNTFLTRPRATDELESAAVLPLLAAKQRTTHPNDWMSTDSIVACPDPNCKSKLKITKLDQRKFQHEETTAVPLETTQ